MIKTVVSSVLQKYEYLKGWWNGTDSRKQSPVESIFTRVIRVYLIIKLIECVINYVCYIDCYHQLLYLYQVELDKYEVFSALSSLISITWVSVTFQRIGNYTPVIYPTGSGWYKVILYQKLINLRLKIIFNVLSFCIHAYMYYQVISWTETLDPADTEFDNTSLINTSDSLDKAPQFIISTPKEPPLERITDIIWLPDE
jgi:hypothetical protein